MAQSLFGIKSDYLVMIACLLLGGFIALHTMCACRKVEGYDGLTSSADLNGSDMSYSMGDGVKGSWEKAMMKATKGGAIPLSIQQKGNTTCGGPPLPASEMVIFADSTYKPECCPSVYSNDQGCVCATAEQYAYLNRRGNNRTQGGDF